MKPILVLTIFISIFAYETRAQSVVQDITEVAAPRSESDLFVETIKLISRSKRIFLLTNKNQQLYPGDFISLLLDNNLICRAIVAKIENDRAGIKIVKIYSLTLWQRLRRDLDVQVLRGDDSYFYKKGKTEEKQNDDTLKIEDSNDLYSDTIIDEPGFDTGKRVLKNDNIITVNYGVLNATDVSGDSTNFPQWSGQWAYQFSDNVFIEGFLGYSQMNNFPGEGVNAAAMVFSGRVKYAFQLPLYSYALPYIGFKKTSTQISLSSPADSEAAVLSDLEKDGTGIALGVTLMRRLVPGWFVKADLGLDTVNIGFGIEF